MKSLKIGDERMNIGYCFKYLRI
eukprot:UN06798